MMAKPASRPAKPIRHHLNDDLLMRYASGHLAEAFGLVVATHVTLCDDCRARLEAFEALGGAVMEAEPEEEISTEALARVMARLEVPVVAAPPALRRRTVLPEPVAEAGEDCLCLAATDAPLRFVGLMPRLLQPLFRI